MNQKPLTIESSDIDWIKGLGILLVVAGHFYSATFTSEWIFWLRRVVYLFHMPLFMTVSGFLYARSRPLPYGELVKKKALRLLLPYVSISALVFMAKMIAAWVHFPLQYPVDRGDLWAFLLAPQAGFAIFLWYLYTLFIIFCVVRALQAAHVSLLGLGILAVLLFYLPLPAIFCLHLVGKNLVFFIFGMGIQHVVGKGQWTGSLATAPATLGSLASFGGLTWLVLVKGAWGSSGQMLAAFAGILSCWTLAFSIGRSRPASFLMWFGRASSAIYLLHTLCMGVTRFLWERYLGVESPVNPMAYFVSAIGLAMILPALLQRFLLDRLPWASRVFLGVSPQR